MSQENVEVFKRGIEAFNRGDLEAVPDMLHPEVVLHLSLPAMFGGEATVFRGHNEYRAFFEELTEAFAEFRIEISEVRDLGERIVGIGRLYGRGRASGAEVESPIAYVVEYRDGKQIRVDDHFDPAEALEAAGLSE